MRGRATRRAVWIGSSLVLVALLFVYNLSSPRAQTVNDINLVPGNTIDVQDLLELLALQNPAFTIDKLLFLISASWNSTIQIGPTPTQTQSTIPTPLGTPTMTIEDTFNLRDYFVTSQGSTWHYIGFNGGSTDDNYRYTVENSLQDLGGGLSAARFRTDTDEPTDSRNGDVDFYLLEDGSKGTGGVVGDLFFYGLFKSNGFRIGVNTVIASNPIFLGGDGLRIGDQIVDTGAASASLGSISLASTVRFAAFLPTFQTPLGTFTNVLRMEVDISGVFSTIIGSIPFEIYDNTFFFKKGVGLIAVDQSPDPNDAELLGIDSGTVYVGGSPVTVTAN